MSGAPAVSVVLVTWNSGPALSACLAALAASVPPPLELVAVDNASTDGSRERLEAFAKGAPFPVRLLPNDANLGFAAGANRGIAAASGEMLFLLNPDLRLLPDTIETLRQSLALAPADVAAAGGKLLRAVGDDLAATREIDSTGIVMFRNGRHLDRGSGEPDFEQWDHLGEVFGLTGAAVLFRREALLSCAVDGEVFDEDFFAYREDADLAWRMRGFGWRALYDPDAVAFHRRTVLPERRSRLPAVLNFHSVKNRFLLRIHHADAGWWLRGGFRSLGRDLLVLGACLTVERSSLPAFGWLLRHLPRHLRRRREILARRRVSSAELAGWFA